MKRSVVLLYSINLLSTGVRAQKDNGANCDCFKTNAGSYFTYHRFFDYRNIDKSLASDPAPITSADSTTDANYSSSFFSNSSWTADWNIQTWNNSDSLNTTDTDATELMIYSNNNVYIESAPNEDPSYTTHLTMRTLRTDSFQSAAEIDSVAQNYQFMSARFLARIRGDSGACAGIFTWRCPGLCRTASSTTVEEADIEILTNGPKNVLQLTNQPSESPNGEALSAATKNASFPSGSTWEGWNEYRYDWTPGLSTWYVNGSMVASISFQAPRDPTQLILNMWGNGGSWTGNMSTGGAAYLQIQYIEIVYNTSDATTGSRMASRNRLGDDFEGLGTFEELDKRIPFSDPDLLFSRANPGCHVVCSIDENKGTKGTPVVVSMAGLRKETSLAALLTSLVVLVYLCGW